MDSSELYKLGGESLSFRHMELIDLLGLEWDILDGSLRENDSESWLYKTHSRTKDDH
jgi:hypothetical protein